MALSAGSVSATLAGNFSPAGFVAFDAAVHRAKRSMDDVEKAGGRMNKAMAVAGKVGATALAGGILAAGLAIGKSVSLAADFEQQLSRLKSVSSATGAQMQMLKKDALAAGAATKFSALDAAKAQTELAKGGLKVADIHGGALKAALALAAAGELDLADAAATTVNAMKQFGISGGEAGHVADVLATAANTTTSDVSDLALALRQGGGVASMAGASFDETVAAISALSDASVKGADAGTSLKSFFLNIATPSKKSSEAMHELGLNIFKTNGDLKSMPGVAASVRQAFSGLTKEQFLSKAGTIAGSDAARALFAIYKAGPSGMRKYLDAQKEVGTAAQVAAEKQDNLRGKIENLKGSLETAGIQLGEGLLPGLTDGAEKLTDTINDMAATGQLEQIGQDLGDVAVAFAEAGPAIAAGAMAAGSGIKLLFDSFKLGASGSISAFLLPVEAMLRAVKLAADGINKISPFKDIPTDGLDSVIDKIAGFRTAAIDAGKDIAGDVGNIGAALDSLGGKNPTIKVSAEVGAAIAAIKSVDSQKIKNKIARILANGDTTTKQKIAAIIALGIPAKVARVIAAGVPQTLGEIAAVRNALGSLPGSKTVTLTTVNRIINQGSNVSKNPPVKLGKKATGRAADGAETALVGEGRGGELVGNQADGWTWVDKPTVMGLGAGDYVIPTDPAYSGRALGFMLAALGVPGYAKGKKPGKKAASKALPIPDAITFGAVPEDDLSDRKDAAREAYQKRKDRVHDLDVDIREDRKKVASAKGAKAKNAAREKLRKAQADRRRYSEGGDGLASLAALRKQWQDLSAQAKVLHATNVEIDRLNTIQETDRTKMETASKRGDAGAWGTAKRDRDSKLATLRDKYAKAVGLAAPGSNFQAELEGKLASVEGDIADAAGEAFTADSPFEGGLTKDERDQLDRLQAGQSLASLTAGLDDDQAAAQATESFLSTLLGAAMADPARGGASVIGDLADQVKQARDNVASFAGGSGGAQNDSADLQAQITRERTLRETAETSARVNAQALSVFQGAGDIGMAPRLVQNNYMLHPSDPQVLATIGNAATAAQSQQPFVNSPRTSLGI